ncbi:MAG: hypothetical protein KGZ25_15010, partial [Planctomycetes bacterium]|nr:hypothetical protein [Planctomycetota bacterium]
MSTRTTQIIAIVLFIAISLFAMAGEPRQSEFPALSLSRVQFVAIEPETGSPRDISLRVSAGAGWPEMDAVNDYADWINDTWGGSVDPIKYHESYRLGLEYPLGENWFAGLAYERLEAETDGTVSLPPPDRHFKLDLSVDGAELVLRRVWPRAVGPVDLEAVLGAGYYKSHYIEEEDGYRVRGDDDALGLRGGVGLNWRATERLDIILLASYRYLKFDRYK